VLAHVLAEDDARRVPSDAFQHTGSSQEVSTHLSQGEPGILGEDELGERERGV
jgi:hypothetical protein